MCSFEFVGSERFIANRDPRNALGVHQGDLGVPIGLQDLSQPILKLIASLRVPRASESAPHQVGEKDITAKQRCVTKPLAAPINQLAHLQIRNGG